MRPLKPGYTSWATNWSAWSWPVINDHWSPGLKQWHSTQSCPTLTGTGCVYTLAPWLPPDMSRTNLSHLRDLNTICKDITGKQIHFTVLTALSYSSCFNQVTALAGRRWSLGKPTGNVNPMRAPLSLAQAHPHVSTKKNTHKNLMKCHILLQLVNLKAVKPFSFLCHKNVNWQLKHTLSHNK